MIRLPRPKTNGGMSLAEALAKRRTHREFSDKPLTLDQVSQLCWAAQGITEPTRGLRTAPSAGALYPVTIFLMDSNGVFEYQPQRHELRQISKGDVRKGPKGASLRQAAVRAAPVCLVVTISVKRTAPKFGDRAEQYCLLEAGHVAQNVLLMATAMDLVSAPIGGAEEAKVIAALDLPEGARPVYLLPVGYAKGR